MINQEFNNSLNNSASSTVESGTIVFNYSSILRGETFAPNEIWVVAPSDVQAAWKLDSGDWTPLIDMPGATIRENNLLEFKLEGNYLDGIGVTLKATTPSEAGVQKHFNINFITNSSEGTEDLEARVSVGWDIGSE